MPRTPESLPQELLKHLRTQSMLAHLIEKTGKIPKKEQAIDLSDLLNAINAFSLPNAADQLTEKRFKRWIKGTSAAERSLANFFKAIETVPLAGTKAAYEDGPMDSKLFIVLTESIDSDDFFSAAGTELNELAKYGEQRRLSSDINDRLEILSKLSYEHPSLNMDYVTTCFAWYRYALLTLHSMDYLVEHVCAALQQLKLSEKAIVVNGVGSIVFPISSALLEKYLVAMTIWSVRFRWRFPLNERPESFKDLPRLYPVLDKCVGYRRVF